MSTECAPCPATPLVAETGDTGQAGEVKLEGSIGPFHDRDWPVGTVSSTSAGQNSTPTTLARLVSRIGDPEGFDMSSMVILLDLKPWSASVSFELLLNKTRITSIARCHVEAARRES